MGKPGLEDAQTSAKTSRFCGERAPGAAFRILRVRHSGILERSPRCLVMYDSAYVAVTTSTVTHSMKEGSQPLGPEG